MRVDVHGTAQCGRGVQGPPNNIVWEGTRWCHREDGGGVIVEQFKDAQRRSSLCVKATNRSDAGSSGSGDVVPIQHHDDRIQRRGCDKVRRLRRSPNGVRETAQRLESSTTGRGFDVQGESSQSGSGNQ